MGAGDTTNPGGGSGPASGGGQNAAQIYSNAAQTFPSTPTDSTTTQCANPSKYSTPVSGSGSGSSPGAGSGSGSGSPPPENNTTGFSSQDAAAKAALNDANPQSIKANKEFGGMIYQDSAGKYHYSGPAQGTDQGFDPSQAPAPKGSKVVGDYHTHGDYSTAGPKGEAVRTSDPKKDDFNSDHFSRPDKKGIKADGKGNPAYRGYLGTPSGKFLTFDPTTGTESEMP